MKLIRFIMLLLLAVIGFIFLKMYPRESIAPSLQIDESMNQENKFKEIASQESVEIENKPQESVNKPQEGDNKHQESVNKPQESDNKHQESVNKPQESDNKHQESVNKPRENAENKVDAQEDFSHLFEKSPEQLLIPKETILKTNEFILEKRDEFDPELVEFVRSLIVRPPKPGKLNLSNKEKTDFSQSGQSRYIDSVLKSETDGFFVESDGYDGENFSNTLFFELERNWTGLLIQPIPSYFHKILAKKRNIFALNACISKRTPQISRFRLLLNEWFDENNKAVAKRPNEEVYVNVPCFTFNTILSALNLTSQVDYLSLDAEGVEFSILKSLDFENILVRTLSLKYNGVEELLKVAEYMKNQDYSLAKYDTKDAFFVKN